MLVATERVGSDTTSLLRDTDTSHTGWVNEHKVAAAAQNDHVKSLTSTNQVFMQDQTFASHTCFGGHMDVNCL